MAKQDKKREIDIPRVSSWDDVEAGYSPAQNFVDCDGVIFLVQELDGRTRFEAAEKADDPRWEMMLWMCDKGIIEPRPPLTDEQVFVDVFEPKMKPEYVLKIAKSIMAMSGMSVDDEEEAGKESASVIDTGGSSLAS